jgi:hypothetical protein
MLILNKVRSNALFISTANLKLTEIGDTRDPALVMKAER